MRLSQVRATVPFLANRFGEEAVFESDGYRFRYPVTCMYQRGGRTSRKPGFAFHPRSTPW